MNWQYLFGFTNALALAGWLMLAVLPRGPNLFSTVLYGCVAILCLTIAAAGVLSAGAMFWSLPTAFLGGVSAAAGIAAINSVGNLAGFVSPYMVDWLKDLTQSTEAGMLAVSAALVAGALVILTIPPRLVNR